MPEQEPIPPPPASGPGPELGPKSTSTGLPSNVAAALACIPLIGGIIFYIVEKHDSFVRFYAMQSIIFGIAWIVIQIGCAIVSGIFWWLINLALFVVFVVTVVKAFANVRWDIPYIGPMARRQEGTV